MHHKYTLETNVYEDPKDKMYGHQDIRSSRDIVVWGDPYDTINEYYDIRPHFDAIDQTIINTRHKNTKVMK